MLVGWIRRLPSSLQETRPQLSYLLGLCALQKGELEAARSLLERAARGFEAAGDAAGQGAALATLASAAYLQLDSERSHALVTRALQSPLSPAMRVQALMTRASLGLFFAGNWEQVTDDFEAAIGIVRESEDPVALFALTLYLGQEFSLLPDGLERLESLCQEIQAQLGESLTPLHLGLEDAMAFIHFRRGRLAQAIQAGERLLAVKERLGGYPFVGVNSAMVVAQAYAAQEAYAFANHYLELMQAQVDQVALNRLTVAGGLYPRAKILWLQGRIAQARQVYAQMYAARGPSETPLLHALRVMARGLLEVSDREYAAAARTFQQAIALEQSVRLVSIFDCPPLLLAHLYRLWQRPGAALDVLSPLLARCAAAETPGAVLQAGAIVVPLLQLAIEREVHAPYATYLLGLLDAPVGPATIAVPETGATLTKRELDVLRLLATGASNRAIAERLVISLPTVKSHVSHILAKLAVSSRGQAAARARELHII
jgi:ATP/maltotriose-dependent transcriptional regulator MalT